MFVYNNESLFPAEVPGLSTKRLDLIEITEEHIDDLYEICSNNYVTKYDDCFSFVSKNNAIEAVISF